MEKSKVLIVEDEAVTAMVLEENLRSYGYEITDIIDRGENVMNSIDKSRPDVILMDIQLKGEMTGIEAANQVAKKHGLPVVYLTANSDKTTFKKAKVTHPYGFILKPFNERELKINIEIALHKKQLEYALEKSYREMESNVEARTLELNLANEQLQNEIEQRKKIEEQVKDNEKRYRNFITRSHEGIWRMEFDQPLSTNTSIKKMAHHILHNGQIVECNTAMSKMYGYDKAEQMVGKTLIELFGADTNEEIDIAFERAQVFIQNGYNTEGAVSTEKDKNENRIYISNSTKGDIENGKLVRLWGIQRDVTKTMHTRKALKESESNLAEAQRLAKIGDWHWDSIANQIVWSDQTFRIFGYQPHETVVNLEVFMSHIHENDKEKVTVAIDQTIKTKVPYDVKFRIVDQQGELKMVHDIGEAIFDENREVIGMRGAIQDVTEKTLASQALKKSESSLVEAQRLAKIGDWHWDTETDKLHWSDQTFRLFDYEPGEVDVDFQFYLRHIHKDDIEAATANIEEAMSNKGAYHNTYKIVTKTGASKTCEVQGEVILDNDGNTIGMRGVCQDITARKHAEDKLVKSEQRFRDVTSISADLVWEINNEGRYIYCSDRVEDLLGYSIEEMMDMTPFDLMPETEAKRERAHFADHIKRPRAIKNHENWNIKKNGELVCLLSNMVTIFDSEGNSKGMRGVDRDITKAKIAEVALQSSNDELERRVNERTKDLNDSNEELKELAYTLSHDLKAPLRGIKTLIDWVHDDNKVKLDETSLQNFQLIDQKVTMLYGLIGGIIEFSKIGGDGGDQEEVNLETVITEVVELLNIPASVDLVIKGKLPTITSSKVQMIQVFQNLISNAIKYSDKDNITIEVGVEMNNSEQIFFVKDNGPGIDPKHFERIFKIFKTLKPKNDGESTGIGLSIVKKIIGKHNGRIWVESEVGKGSCFYFTLHKG